MRKVILSVIVALAVAGCAGSIQNPVTNSRLYAAEASYKVALDAMVAYRDLYDRNPCRKGKHATFTNVCAERGIVVKLQAADAKVQIALKNGRAWIRQNPTLDASNVVASVEASVAAFNAVANTTGVQP